MASDIKVTATSTAPATANDAELIARSAMPRKLGPVTLVREIGRGGMGTVWLGRHELLERDVAVKFLLTGVLDRSDPRFIEFLAGARAASAVRHLGLTAIHHADLVEGLPYLVMEYVEGPSLAQLLRAAGAISPTDAVAVMRGIAAAVAELHERSIIHRDIKPANVLVDQDGRTYVTDFGLACLRGAGGARVAGTPAYMAPELWGGEISPRTDVFALGVMTYELIAGQVPFAGDAEQVRRAYSADPLPTGALRAKGAGPQLIDVIERAMHWDPMFRYKTARHFARALEQLCDATTNRANVLMQMVARTRGAAAAEPHVGLEPSSADRYYSGLATLAEKKRQKSGSPVTGPREVVFEDNSTVVALRANDAGGPPSALQNAAPNSEGRLNRSWPCIRCEYDLRWQHRDGVCPECACPLSLSIPDDLLIFADVRWLKQIRRALLVCEIPMGFLTLVWFLLPVATIYLYPRMKEAGTADFWFRVLAVGVRASFFGCLLAIGAGAIALAAAQPNASPAGRGRRLRPILRASGYAWLALTAVIVLTPVAPAESAMRNVGERIALIAFLTFPYAVGLSFLVLYLRSLAQRLQRQRLVQHANRTLLVVSLLIGAGAADRLFLDRDTGGTVAAEVWVHTTILGMAVLSPIVIGMWLHRLRKALNDAITTPLRRDDLFVARDAACIAHQRSDAQSS